MRYKVRVQDLGYGFLFLSGICILSHLYLLIHPYSYVNHVPNFCIVGVLLIYGYQWNESKKGSLPPVVSIIYENDISFSVYPSNWFFKVIHVYVMFYIAFSFLFHFLDKELSFFSTGANMGAFMFWVLSIIGRFYVFDYGEVNKFKNENAASGSDASSTRPF